MSSKEQPVTFWGAIIMFWLLIAAIIFSTIPMMVGVAVVALIPGIGELRSTNPWHLLHFLWMYPAVWVFSLIIEPILKHLFATGNSRKFGDFLEDLLMWLLISWFYTVFFRDPSGALLAGLISISLLKPLVDWLEKHAPADKDGQDEEGQAEERGGAGDIPEEDGNP